MQVHLYENEISSQPCPFIPEITLIWTQSLSIKPLRNWQAAYTIRISAHLSHSGQSEGASLLVQHYAICYRGSDADRGRRLALACTENAKKAQVATRGYSEVTVEQF